MKKFLKVFFLVILNVPFVCFSPRTIERCISFTEVDFNRLKMNDFKIKLTPEQINLLESCLKDQTMLVSAFETKVKNLLRKKLNDQNINSLVILLKKMGETERV